MTVLTSASTADEIGRLAASRSRRAELTARLASSTDPPQRARLLLDVGRHDEARALVPELLADPASASPTPAVLQAAAILFAVHDFELLAPLMEAWSARPDLASEARRLVYRWWFAIDDLERVERVLEERAAESSDLVDRLARARLHAFLLEREAAQAAYETALTEADTDQERSWARHGLGVVLHQRLDFDGAFAHLTEALAAAPLDVDLLTSLGEVLIRLSHTDEAMDLFELAVELAPYHERAHYMLGNGYARRSYSQLNEAFPEAFADEAGRAAFRRAEELLAAGRSDAARALYEELRSTHREWADLATRLASLAFAERRYGEARRLFAEALKACPEYGRAHNGLAKALQAERQRFDVYQETYERRFEDLTATQVEGLEDYIANWTELEPRHRKQVALSVAPWARYVPVLLEAGSTHYIKPLHERLSESPEMQHLADQRISYDSRLWDDVRGVGGHHTVTGVEDVERIPLNGYNTVLHELTHQVHQVLPSEDRRRIQELYRRTKERDERNPGGVFLSRYAGGSVWEYFAEGANSLASPRRDRFDTREIVRERLEERDPELLGLVRELMDKTDLDGAHTVALVNRGYHHLRWGRAEDAVSALRRALRRTPDSEEALDALNHALNVAGRASEALDVIEEAARARPESAELVTGYAQTLWLVGRGLDTAYAALDSARDGVREEERYLVDLRLGTWAWTAGEAPAARRAYESVIAYQADHPHGLWGLAASHALAGEWEEAWERYDEAVRHRTGIVDLRVSYAWDLLRAAEPDRCRSQIDAALLLDPDDAEALAVEALWFLATGSPDDAASVAERALKAAPWCDLARCARARALTRIGHADAALEALAPLTARIRAAAPPEYVYRPDQGRYLLVHTLPALLRAEIRQVDGERPRPC